MSAPAAAAGSIDPVAGTLKTEYSANARSKCQLCHMKICKGSWRMFLAVHDPHHPHSDGRPRVNWVSSHATCYLENATRPVNLSNSTQSMPYYAGASPDPAWNSAPKINYPATEEGELIGAALAALNPADTLSQSLPPPALQACHAAAVAAAVAGTYTLNDNDRNIFELFCLHKKLTEVSRGLMKISEAAEAELPQPDESGDPLKSKFTQYSPNSMAHCRDCHQLLVEGAIRVGAHVFSSSSRHAGFSINYWCLECMCARPAVRRMARLYPTEIEKVLPGADLLAEADLQRTCTLLGITLPDPALLTALAAGRIRATRSGRKFNTWGGGGAEEQIPVPAEGGGEGGGGGGGGGEAAAGAGTGAGGSGTTAGPPAADPPRNKRARR